MARIGLHLPNVTGIDRTVNCYVRPEVARADCYARLRLHKANIARIYAAIACPSRVADKHSHRNQDITGASSIVHIRERNPQPLSVCYPGEINGDHRRPLPLKVALPVPDVTDTPPTVTGLGKVTTI